MAGSVNKVIVIGNLGQDPQSRSFQNGGKVVTMSVATSESWKDRNSGERREKTEWHRISIFAEHAAEFAEKYLRKGMKVYIEGQLETRKWQDQDGTDRYSTEVVVRPFKGVLTSLEKVERNDGWDQHDESSRGQSRGDRGGRGGGGGGFQDDLDDDVPF